jgi:hypothetical protein
MTVFYLITIFPVVSGGGNDPGGFSRSLSAPRDLLWRDVHGSNR